MKIFSQNNNFIFFIFVRIISHRAAVFLRVVPNKQCFPTQLSKKKDQEIARLRKEVEDNNAAAEAALASAKSKHSAALAEVQDEVENVKKAKAKSDKEKTALAAELSETQSEVCVDVSKY